MSEYFTLKAPYFSQFKQLVQDLELKPEQSLILESSAYQDFTCSQCGDCCTLPWHINIDKDYYEKWYPIFDANPSFKNPFVPNQNAQNHNWASIRRKQGTTECIFLEADQTCYIHNYHGDTALSSVCRGYPKSTKNIGYPYHVNYLLPSCKDVPKLQINSNSVRCKIVHNTPIHPRVTPTNPENQFERSHTYLWLGLSLDVLNAENPDNALDRLHELSYAWEWMDAIGFKKIKIEQIEAIHNDLMGRLPYCGFKARDPAQIKLALQWGKRLLQRHPGCHKWLIELKENSTFWPQIETKDHNTIDQYIQAFIQNRFLTLPYEDAFTGALGLWQQCFFLSLQVLAIQILFLYFRFKHPSSPSEELLTRAINFVSQTIIQNTHINKVLDLNKLNSAQCFEGIQTATSLNLACPQTWLLNL